MPDPHLMAFKGGTSLSKVYRIIDRFSEDVDVTIDYRAFDDGFDPFADSASRTQITRFSERLKDHVVNYIRDVVAPALGAAAIVADDAPAFDALVEEIRILEADANRLG